MTRRPPDAGDLALTAPLSGWVGVLGDVPDPVFAERMLGDGVAIEPLSESLHAPCDGEIVSVAATRHAVTVRAANGAEILMHVGLDTVALGGAGFEAHVVAGQAVRAGDRLLSFDLDAIARRAKSAVTPIVLSNGDAFEMVWAAEACVVTQGDTLLTLRRRDGAPEATARGGHVLEGELVVDLAHGLHARPAARLVAALKPFAARVQVGCGDRMADGRSAVALMGLGATTGARLRVRAEGDDAAAAVEALRTTLTVLAREEDRSADPPPPVAAAMSEPAPAGALRGVRAAPGLAIGVLMRLQAAEPVVRTEAEAPATEAKRLADALLQVSAALNAQSAAGDPHRRDILAAHQAVLTDPELLARADRAITAGRSAGVAWRDAVATSVAALQSLSDARLAQRADDLIDLERQVLLALSGETVATPVLPVGAIVVADELLPSQLLALEGSPIGGLCTARGGPTSHVAILAAAMGLPALCAVGPALLEIRRGVTAVLDADAGLLHVAPSPEVLAGAQAELTRRTLRRQRQRQAALDPGRLADGARIEVFANLGAAAEAAGATALGAEGCGLFRTEFLYLDRAEAPDEAEQRAAYQASADGLEGRPLVIRTLDAGGDKPLAFAPTPYETNPALGLRGLRASLRRPDLLRTQVAAVLGVSGPGERRLLLPMVTDIADLRAARALIDAVVRDLGVAPVKLGVMIETPASALLADQLAAEADFLSIGTNDLTQYVLAMDRENPELAPQLDSLHPALLRLIGQTARAARTYNRPVSVCGGLASDPLAAPILVGLGIGCLSAAPAAVPGLKHRLRSLTAQACHQAAEIALTLGSAQAVRAMLMDRLPVDGELA